MDEGATNLMRGRLVAARVVDEHVERGWMRGPHTASGGAMSRLVYLMTMSRGGG